MKYHVTVEGREFLVEVRDGGEGGRVKVVVEGSELVIEPGPGGETKSAEEGWEVVLVAGSRRRAITLLPLGNEAGKLRLLVQNRPVAARVESERDRLRALSRPVARKGGRITARSTLPGVIRRVLVQAGAAVDEGTPILTLEAMKMENEVRAEAKGRLHVILVKAGQVVNAGDALAEIDLG